MTGETKWLPIETAPKDGTDILLRIPNSNPPVVGYWHAGETWRVTWDGTRLTGYVFDPPTQWMPLPAPPEAAHE